MAVNGEALGKVEFLAFHKPGLTSGEYRIGLNQKLSTAGSGSDLLTAAPSPQYFVVRGERITIKPAEIQAVFPPAGGLGDYSNALPHLVLTRSTLPWERSADSTAEGLPWLALLLFTEDDKPASSVISLAEWDPGDGSVFAPAWNSEIGEQQTDKLTVIDVRESVLRAILPAADELHLLAHARQGQDAAANPDGPDMAVIMGNRLPLQGGINTVHLVSLEHRYTGAAFSWPPLPDDDNLIRLISLKSWSFSCLASEQSFSGLLERVDRQPSTPRLPGLPDPSLRMALSAFADDGGGGNIVLDTSAAAGHGGVQGAAVIAGDTEKGNCLELDGGTAYILLSDAVALGLNSSSFTVTAWFLLDAAALGDNSIAGTDETLPNEGLQLLAAAGGLRFSFTGPTTQGATALSTGVWYHAAFRYDSVSAEQTIFLNGVSDGQTGAIPAFAGSGALMLGRSAGGNYFKGRLADVQIFARALDNSEIFGLAKAEPLLAEGAVLLPHYMRQGQRSVAWYRGPLTGGSGGALDLPVETADSLLRYDPASGVFDLRYAAAWELGRHLALQSKSFARSLYTWKRRYAQNLRRSDQNTPFAHLPTVATSSPSASPAAPDEVVAWFNDRSLLRGLPFSYLLPDERMLPKESIRFFRLDTAWVKALLDGAFSIGRVTTADGTADGLYPNSPAANPYSSVSGLLLRSDVVAGFPDLLVDAYSAAIDSTDTVLDEQFKLPLLRMDRLSPNILICLFDGDLKTVDIHRKPEMLHFGFDKPLAAPDPWIRRLRDPATGDLYESLNVPLPWRDENERTVQINQLATDIETALGAGGAFTAAQFALQMIEGAEMLRFVITGS